MTTTQQKESKMKAGTRITRNVKLVKIERFERVNIHRPGNYGVELDGQVYYGALEYFGAVWFQDEQGQLYVSFTKKTTQLWQSVRAAEIGTEYTIQANYKEHRIDEEHGNRIVVTRVSLKECEIPA